MNKIKKLHRYVHGLTKDEKPFLFLDFFHLEIDETGCFPMDILCRI